MIKNILTVCMLMLAAPIQAADTTPPEELKFYDIEIIIFKNDSVPKGKEYNLPTPSATPTENTIDLADPESLQQAESIGFSVLPLEQLRLTDSVNRIVRSSRYQLLLHTGWRQPGLDSDNSIPVWVVGGKVFGKDYSSIDQVSMLPSARPPDQASGADQGFNLSSSTMRPGRKPDVLYELEGMVTVTLSRYLHTRAELVLRKPANADDLVNQALVDRDSTALDLQEDSIEDKLLLNYEMREQRRMRSKKLHYLDHPEFGMLVLISPYDSTEEMKKTEEAEANDMTAINPPAE